MGTLSSFIDTWNRIMLLASASQVNAKDKLIYLTDIVELATDEEIKTEYRFFKESPVSDQHIDALMVRLVKVRDRVLEKKARKQTEHAIAHTVAGAHRRGQAGKADRDNTDPAAKANTKHAKAMAGLQQQLQEAKSASKALAAQLKKAGQKPQSPKPPKKDGKAKGDGKTVACFNCGGNHFARDCPEKDGKGKGKGKSKSRSRSGSSSRSKADHSELTCHHCKQKGHIRPNCPELKGSGASGAASSSASSASDRPRGEIPCRFHQP